MKRLSFSKFICALSVLVLFGGETVYAGSATANLSVTATVVDSCTINAGTLAFGSYDPTAATATSASSALAVTCSLGTVATIKLGQGSNAASGSSDASPSRRLTDGQSHYLNYSVYQDGAQLLPWGNTTLTGKTYVALSNSSTNISVYGVIPASQNATPGSYTDTVLVTVSF